MTQAITATGETVLTLRQKLSDIQVRLDAPKSQYNSFGKYHYRKCEDILSALKPFLTEHKCTVQLSDEIIEVGGRVYVKATASICDDEDAISAVGFAREAVDKKGMDDAQITGTSSSYARKYALNGLFAIDDEQDGDSNEHQNQQNNAPKVTDNKSGSYNLPATAGAGGSRGAATNVSKELEPKPPEAKPEFLTAEQHAWLQTKTGLEEKQYKTWLIARMRDLKPEETFEVEKIPYGFAKALAEKASSFNTELPA